MSLTQAPSHYILPVFFFFFLIFTITTTTAQTPFICKSTTTKCTSLIEYISPNDTTISNITTLFNISNNLYSLLGANNLPSTTLPSSPIKAKQSLIIPFPCRCSNGVGTSDGVPVYTVVPNDGLYHIAAEVFANLIPYQEIQRVNNIPNADKIEVGQRLVIPLPCSCDDVDGDTVVHYGHVVPTGSSVGAIAKEFGTTEETLLRLNNLSTPNDLKAASVLDVPLKACRSQIRNTSPDSTLRVPNGSYVLTANNCVKCQCDAANNYTLQCQESGIKPSSTWSSCPRTQCIDVNLSLGNTTVTSSGCDRTTCDYEGYDNRTILTSARNSTCTAPAGANSATTISSQGWRWNFLLIAVQVTVLSLHLFQ